MPITINGDGTVTGISAGGLPDGSISTADIADDAVTLAKLSTTGTPGAGNFLRGDNSWQEAGGGAWTFIASATASASSSVDFTSGINSTYDTYMLTITSLVASSSSLRPFLQVSVGGTFATANYHYYVNGYGSGGGAVDAGAAYGESMRLQGNTNMYSDTAKTGSGIIYFHNPASTTTYSNFHWKWTFWSLTDVVMNDHGSGLYNGSTGAIDGVRLLAGASGNFTSGTFRLYGLAKS